MVIGTFDTHKALTATDYGTAFRASRKADLDTIGWQGYGDEVANFDGWLERSGVKPFIDQVASAKGLELVLCVSKAKPDYNEFSLNHKLVLDRISLLDPNVFIRIDSSTDITNEVMALLWADVQSKM